MYQLVLIILVIFSFIEVFTGKRSRIWFNIAYLLMCFIAIFRYGQLSDYFSYMTYYNNPALYEQIDPLFGGIIFCFKSLSLDFEVFMSSISALCMFLPYRFFKEDCGYSCIGLLLFYCFGFLMCPMEATRQGICLALLLYLYPAIKHKNYVKFYVCVFIGCFIHLSFIVVSIIPFIASLKFFNKTCVIYALVGLTLFAFTGSVLSTLFQPFQRVMAYEDSNGESILLQMMLRILIILPVLLYKPKQGSDGYYSKAICITGYALYCLLSFNTLVAGRVEYYFRTFLCLFVAYVSLRPAFLFLRSSMMTLLIALHVFIYFKSLYAVLTWYQYHNDVTVFNFPYISVFNEEDFAKYSDKSEFID